MKTRDQKITDAITNDGFTYNDTFYRALSTRMLLLLEKFKSPFYTGGDQMRGLMDFLYIASGDLREIQRMTPSEFEDAVFEFADTLTTEDLNNLGKLSRSSNDDSASTVIQVKEDASGKK